jgi:hypothetical protein
MEWLIFMFYAADSHHFIHGSNFCRFSMEQFLKNQLAFKNCSAFSVWVRFFDGEMDFFLVRNENTVETL